VVLKGGRVIDPKNNIDAVMDVAIADGKIARVAADIPVENARQVIPAAGLYVVPGLIDLHVHVYAISGVPRQYVGSLSVQPDDHSFRNGVTTMVDAGTSGARNFEDFKRRIIDSSRTRVLAWLNIVGAGMAAMGAEQNKEDMDSEFAAAMAKRYPETIVGFKTAHFNGPEWIAVERAVEAGRLANIPVMVDFGRFRPERPFQQLVLEKLRPGDVYTHMYLAAVPFLDADGKLLPYLAEARKRGVRFDVGHGGGSFVWYQAVPAVQQGWLPDTISTDLHVTSMNGGMKDMTTCMSKFLNLGVPLKDVIRMSTSSAAEQIHRTDLGALDVGARADVTVLRQDEGDFAFIDVRNSRLKGRLKLDCEVTLKDGRVVWDLNGRAARDWSPADAQRPNSR
jgi:dihydroorotase